MPYVERLVIVWLIQQCVIHGSRVLLLCYFHTIVSGNLSVPARVSDKRHRKALCENTL